MSLSLLLATVAFGPALPSHDPVAEYRAMVAAFQAAFNRGDGHALGDLYHPDATLLDPDGSRLVGQEAIRAYYVAGLTGPIKGARTRLTIASIRQASSDVLVGEGSYLFEMPGQPPVRGIWLNVAVQRAGTWRIHSDMGAPAPR